MTTSLQQIVIDEIKKSSRRALPFSRFMELSLYHPDWGYYQTKQMKLGKEGDFFTNAHVGDLVGKVLGRVFHKWSHKPYVIVEMGPGDGRLTEAVIGSLLQLGVSPDMIQFFLVETSDYMRQCQQKRLSGLPISCKWASHILELPKVPFAIVYSNELVDAFPVHRICQVGENLQEVCVTFDEDQEIFHEVLAPLSTTALQHFIQDFEIKLTEGQVIEVNLQAYDWLKELASWMETGYLLTIDYGGTQEELFNSVRKNGTIRYYRHHQILDDPYSLFGEIDMTSHVNFSSLMKWGEELEFQTVGFQTQGAFLLDQGILDLVPVVPASNPFSPEAKQMRAMQQLIHPDGMGEVFRVLVQKK
ncbi:class I SAM-dependent methyltransferase [Thermoflavimicrobium daqui]|uniref:class I SAM-dependent methyltransferase n=1 Tax=Thermoflavimicrobium daqui TaxID=2137476 RepID=UPI0011AB36FD|nr:SAM-dependent methyltransferase [Thermoflavimicrobium daqui]